MSEKLKSEDTIATLGLDKIKRHIFFCIGPNCCNKDEGQQHWSYLKDKLKKLKVAAPGGSGEIFRTQVHCLRVCCDGPIAVVYPEGSWYRFVDQHGLDRIIQEHLLEGKIVEELLLIRHPLAGE